MLGVRRGRTSFAFSLRRPATGAASDQLVSRGLLESRELERAAVSVRGGVLFSPRLAIEFPPPGEELSET